MNRAVVGYIRVRQLYAEKGVSKLYDGMNLGRTCQKNHENGKMMNQTRM